MTQVLIPPVLDSAGLFVKTTVTIRLVDAKLNPIIGWRIDDGTMLIERRSLVLNAVALTINMIPQGKVGTNDPSVVSYYEFLLRTSGGKHYFRYLVQIPDTDVVQELADLVGLTATPESAVVFSTRLVPAFASEPTGYALRLVDGAMAWLPVNEQQVISTGSPNGFLDRTQAQITWDDNTRTLTIVPVSTDYVVFVNGTRHVVSEPMSYQIPNVTGNHFIYFKEDMAIHETENFERDLIFSWGWIAGVYWNATEGKAVPDALSEMHGAGMASETHEYLHTTIGTAYKKDGGILPAAISPDGDGSLLENLQISVTAGTIRDEDISHTIPAKVGSDLISVLYLDANGNWAYDISSSSIVRSVGSGRAAYNAQVSGVWSRVEVGNNQFVLAHLFALPGLTRKLFILMGRAVYNNINSMRANAAKEILGINDLKFLEYKSIATFAVQTSNSYTNAFKSRIVSVDSSTPFEDWRYG